VPDESALEVTLKPAEDGDGIVVRIRNLGSEPATVPVELLGATPSSASSTSPIEVDRGPLEVAGRVVSVPVGAGALETVRVRFKSS
jgi:predicted secreted protein